MKIKVLKRFHDKVTDEVYEIGDIVEVTNERGNEIVSNPLGVAEILEGGSPDNNSGDGLSSLSKKELFEKAKELEIDVKELKDKESLIAAIEAKLAESAE